MTLQNIEDKLGNMIYEKSGTIYLYLKTKGTRKLWELFEDDLYVRRLNKHIFRKYNAYWFNNLLLKHLNPTKKIFVKQEDWSVLEILISDAIAKGYYRGYHLDWFESQLLVPIKEFTFRK